MTDRSGRNPQQIESDAERGEYFRTRAERLGYRGVDVDRYVDARLDGLSDREARAEVLRLFRAEEPS
jgi:hypothetical protein